MEHPPQVHYVFIDFENIHEFDPDIIAGREISLTLLVGAKQTKLLRSLLARLADNLQSVKPLKAMARENLANVLLEGDATQLNRALQKDVYSKEALRALQEPMLAILIGTGLFVALVQFGMSLASVMLLAASAMLSD